MLNAHKVESLMLEESKFRSFLLFLLGYDRTGQCKIILLFAFYIKKILIAIFTFPKVVFEAYLLFCRLI